MKKLTAVLLSLLMVLSLCACGSDQGQYVPTGNGLGEADRPSDSTQQQDIRLEKLASRTRSNGKVVTDGDRCTRNNGENHSEPYAEINGIQQDNQRKNKLIITL